MTGAPRDEEDTATSTGRDLDPDAHVAGGRRSGWRNPSLNGRAWLLLAIFTVGLCVFGAVQTARTRNEVRSSGSARAGELATLQAAKFKDLVDGFEGAMNSLAATPGVSTLTAAQCPLIRLDLGDATLNVVDRAGHIICSSKNANKPTSAHPTATPYAGSTWLHTTGSRIVLSYNPNTPLLHKPSIELVRAAGKNVLLTVPLNVESARAAIELPDTSSGQKVILGDGSGHVILQAPSGTGPKPSRDAALLDRVRSSPLLGTAAVPGTDWKVYVTLDWPTALQHARGQLVSLYIALVAAFLFGLLIVLLIRRWVLRPLHLLRRTAAIAEQDPDVRAPSTGPAEVAALGHRFNGLLDARDHAQEQLSQALVALLRTRESERRQLAIHLHDNTVQSLILASWVLDDLVGGDSLADAGADADTGPLENPDEEVSLTRAEVHQLRSRIATAVRDLRRQSTDLMPEALTFGGLLPAVRAALDRLASEDGTQVHLEHDLQVPLSKELETLAFRTIQEALRNVHKHAHAANVWVQLSSDGVELRAQVRDDGVGFTEEQLELTRRQQHLGVVSMRQTIALAGGTFSITSEESGTCVDFCVPRSRSISAARRYTLLEASVTR